MGARPTGTFREGCSIGLSLGVPGEDLAFFEGGGERAAESKFLESSA